LVLALAGCAARHPAPTEPAAATKLGDSFYDAYMAFHPTAAVKLGLHERDGQLGDRSSAAIAAEIARLHAALDAFRRAGGVETAILANVARRSLFDLEVRRAPTTNPFYYLWEMNVQDYIATDYAPLADRARAVLAYARAAHGYLETARTNLVGPIPRPWIDVSLVIV